MSENIIHADHYSLWRLLDNETIVVPEYQREYAYGRQTGDAPEIRKALINELINAICDKEKRQIELNFVYGGKVEHHNIEGYTETSFHLVDGQQRLTTLFTFYWYVIMQAEMMKPEKMSDQTIKAGYGNLKNFKYKTRTSSSSFCEQLLKISKEDLSKKNVTNRKRRYPGWGDLAVSIMEMTWFTGVMYSDPTVKSILVVLDEINSQFHDRNDLNWKELANRLIADSSLCPIVFLGLNMEQVLGKEEKSIRDLYIKMNSRGKLLTDFEIFKSLLSKKLDSKSNKFDLLASYFSKCNIADTNQNRVELISKFNCEYSDGFFIVVDNGEIIDNTGRCQKDMNCQSIKSDEEEQKFDVAMMNFVNEVFRINYVVTAVESEKKDRREYENYYNRIKQLNGKGLYNWIAKKGHLEWKNDAGQYEDNYLFSDEEKAKKSLTESFEQINHLFMIISNRAKNFEAFSPFSNDNCYINEAQLICNLSSNDISLQSTVRRYGIFLFWDMFFDKDVFPTEGTELYKAYKTWSRFVYNMTYEFPEDDLYKAVENACQECLFFKKLLNWVQNSDEILTARLIYDAIIKNDNAPAVRFEMQFGEEQEKARLMINSSEWTEAILKAESYFEGSRIWPLLELSNKDYNEFNRWFDIFKIVFDKYYKVSIDSSLFERALLCMDDNTEARTGHLEVTDMYSFLEKDYRTILSKRIADYQPERHKVILSLIKALGNSDKEIIETLGMIITDKKELKPSWKRAFVDNFIINSGVNGFYFRHGIMPDKTDFGDIQNDESYTLLYTAAQKRTYCAELYSFILASKLKESHDVTYISAYYNESYYDENNNLPRRYLICDQQPIYYYKGDNGIGFYNNIGDYYGSSVDDVLSVLNA